MKRLREFYIVAVVILAAFAYGVTVFAQGETAPAMPQVPVSASGGINELIFLGISALITLAISGAKRITFVKDYARPIAVVVSFALNALLPYVTGKPLGGAGVYIAYAMTQAVAAIGSYELGVKPIAALFKSSGGQ